MSPPEPLPPIGAPATRALAAIGISWLEQLAGFPRARLAALHGVGPKALRILEQELARNGLELGE